MTTETLTEIRAIMPVEISFLGASWVEEVTVETTEDDWSDVVSVLSVSLIETSVSELLSERGKLVSVSVNSSESVTSGSVPVSDVVEDTTVPDVLVVELVFVVVLVSVLVVVVLVSVFVEVVVLVVVLVVVDVETGVSSVVEDVDPDPPPSVDEDGVLRVIFKGEGAVCCTGVLLDKMNFVTEREIVAESALLSTTRNGMVITTPEAVIS